MITEFEVIADGVVRAYANGGMIAQVNNPKTLAHVMEVYGLADETNIKGGNGLPFNDKIIDEAIGIYNWQVNGVA